MEETIGYEALFSAEEWDSMTFAEWTDGDGFDPDGDSSPSGVTTNGDGNAALSQAVASEGTSPHEQEHEPAAVDLGLVHEVSSRTRELVDGTTEYVLECAICEEIGTADTLEEADAITRLHESFVAELVGRWEVA